MTSRVTSRHFPRRFVIAAISLVISTMLFPIVASAHTAWVWTTPGTATYWTYHVNDEYPQDYDCNGGPYSLGIGASISNSGGGPTYLTFNNIQVYSYNNTSGSYAYGGVLWIQDVVNGVPLDNFDLYGYALIEYTQTIYTSFTAEATSSYPAYIVFHSFGGGNMSEYCNNVDKVVYSP